MIYPDFLHTKDTIGFIAPSFGCSFNPYHACLNQTIKRFKEMGYNTWVGPNCYLSEGIGISNKPSECAAELMDAYTSGKCDFLMAVAGGELMCEILEYIDFNSLRKVKPKWYMGFSDNTNFGFLSTTILNVASIYSPNACVFAMNKWHPAVNDLYDLITGKKLSFVGYSGWEKESLKSESNPYASYNITQQSIIKVYSDNSIGNFKPVSFTGRLTGGCLDCLANLVGTKYDRVEEYATRYADSGIVWFLEACDLNVMDIRRALWQLDNAGWFRHSKGFIIGRPYNFNQPMMGLDQYSAVTGILGKYNVPIIMDADIGHIAPSIPLINGSIATIKVQDRNYSITMELK